MIRATAPGKIILLGEHAVVYGQPALAIPVTQVSVTVQIDLEETIPREIISDWKDLVNISAPDIGRSGLLSQYSPDKDPIALVIENVMAVMGVSNPPKCQVKIDSTIPVASGLGSGAAVSVALARAMSSTLGQELSDDIISQIAFEAEKLHHGTPSGIDNAVITYENPVYFLKDQPIVTFEVKEPFTVIIADTGIRVSTAKSVGDVRKLWQGNSTKYELIFSKIGEIVKQARQAIQDGEIKLLGQLMNQNHGLLKGLTVSSTKLDQLCEAALSSGACGAKLSGGGRGGNMIALVSPKRAAFVTNALLKAGAKQTFQTQVR